MLTIGLMTGYGTKLMPPDWFWSVGAAFTLVGLAVLLPLMKEEAASASARAAPATPVPRWAGRQPRVASLAIALSGLLGATAVPFTTYLSAYLTNEIGRPEAVSSAVWQVLGITGALSGLCIGSFADRYDYRKIIAVIFLAFAVACAFLSFAPSSSYISLAGIGHGIALNPFWGLIAAYISFSSRPPKRCASTRWAWRPSAWPAAWPVVDRHLGRQRRLAGRGIRRPSRRDRGHGRPADDRSQS